MVSVRHRALANAGGGGGDQIVRTSCAHEVGEGLDDGSSNGDNVESSVSSSMLDGIEPAVREQILATNKLDLALYKRTVELYHERCPVPRVLRRRLSDRQAAERARRSSKALGIG